MARKSKPRKHHQKTFGYIFGQNEYEMLHRLPRHQRLRIILSRWETLLLDPVFLKACDTFFNEFTGGQRMFKSFCNKWGAYPLPGMLFSLESFRKSAEQFAERRGAIDIIKVYPWTTRKELTESLSTLPVQKRGSKVNFSSLYWKYILLYLKNYGFSAKDIAEATDENTKKRAKRRYSAKLSEKEHARADQALKENLSKALDYRIANSKATRTVRKARYREDPETSAIRMALNRAWKDISKIARLVKAASS